MRPFPFLVVVVAVVACKQSEEPANALQGSWSLAAAHHALEPYSLTLRQSGSKIAGEASVSGLDPAGMGPPTVPVSGSSSGPTVSLDFGTEGDYSSHYSATLDRADHMTGVLTFGSVLGGGSDTVSYVRQ